MDEKQLHKTIEIARIYKPAFIQYINGIPQESDQKIECAVALCPSCRKPLLEFPQGVSYDHATILTSMERIQGEMSRQVGDRCPYCGQLLSFDKTAFDAD